METHRVDMSQPDAFEKRVKEAIEKTGLPTEIQATKTLVDNGWQVHPHHTTRWG